MTAEHGGPGAEATTDPSGDRVLVHEDRQALCRAAARELLDVLAAAVADRGSASAVLTGGGTGTGILGAVAELLVAGDGTDDGRSDGGGDGGGDGDGTDDGPDGGPGDGVTALDWSRVHLWWGDERYLRAGDPERNEVQADAALVDLLVSRHGLPAQNVHRMPAAGPRPAERSGAGPEEVGPEGAAAREVSADGTAPAGAGPQEAAVDYAAELARRAAADPGPDPRLPVLDVVMLGVGPDAHVASLFPGLPGPLATGATVIGVEDSPKPPPLRVSLTVEALNTARRLWFVVAGEDKRESVAAVRSARNGKTTDAARWPASVVSGQNATTWWLDGAAVR